MCPECDKGVSLKLYVAYVDTHQLSLHRCCHIEPPPLPLYTPPVADGQLDLLFALDVSGSIRIKRFRIIQDLLVQVVDDLEIAQGKTHVGLLSFSDNPMRAFHLQVSWVGHRGTTQGQ